MTRDLGFTPEYVESIPPIERTIYWQYHIEVEMKKQQETKGETTYNAMSPDLPVDRMKRDGLINA